MLRLPRKQRPNQPPENEQPTLHSTQCYSYPVKLKRGLLAVSLLGSFMMTFGLGTLVSGVQQQNTTWLSLGLLTHVLGIMCLVGVLVSLLCITREVRFTFDRVIIFQFFRKPVTLSYNEYNFQWVADVKPNGSIRLLMVDHHRGCTVVSPPDWVRDNFNEIARIQEEEGWYGPKNH